MRLINSHPAGRRHCVRFYMNVFSYTVCRRDPHPPNFAQVPRPGLLAIAGTSGLARDVRERRQNPKASAPAKLGGDTPSATALRDERKMHDAITIYGKMLMASGRQTSLGRYPARNSLSVMLGAMDKSTPNPTNTSQPSEWIKEGNWTTNTIISFLRGSDAENDISELKQNTVAPYGEPR